MAKIMALKCPSCAANISLNTKKCEYCGTELVISPDRTALIFASLEKCPKCGNANPRGQWFCIGCEALISVDDRFLERQKRERFLQNQYRELLPKDLLEKLDTNEYIHYLYYSANRLYYVVTEKRLVVWTYSPAGLLSQEKKDFWELKHSDIAYANDPQHQSGLGIHSMEIGTYSKERKILHFFDSSGSWNFNRGLKEAYLNYLNRKRDIIVRICFSDFEAKDSTGSTLCNCSNCGKLILTFSKDIVFCPYCGKQLSKEHV